MFFFEGKTRNQNSHYDSKVHSVCAGHALTKQIVLETFQWLSQTSPLACCEADSYLGKSSAIVLAFNAEQRPFDLLHQSFLSHSISQFVLFCSKLFGRVCICVSVHYTYFVYSLCSRWLSPALIHCPLHFPFAFLLSSIISTTDKLFNKFDSKKCLNASVMAVLTRTPSLGSNLCYWPAEDELSTGEKKSKGLKW